MHLISAQPNDGVFPPYQDSNAFNLKFKIPAIDLWNILK